MTIYTNFNNTYAAHNMTLDAIFSYADAGQGKARRSIAEVGYWECDNFAGHVAGAAMVEATGNPNMGTPA
ncbi:MAG: hypothetical protein R3E64_16395 [Halioglobus sp.]|nr:hypothetical protein [Halioglobus sp.]|tara:strand:+ start:13811 stop:14020 length:210 start_codon:yes stop_codon:yes gene_type:complete